MGIKEQVKQGKLSVAEALTKAAPGTKTHGWLTRRPVKKVGDK
jgi:hypothetical protein